MKKVVLIILLLQGLFIMQASAQEQKNATDTLAPYKKYPVLPAFNVLSMDSVTIFNTYNIPKGRTIALLFFSPDCGHCKRMTNRIIDSMDMLKDIDFYMITPVHDMSEIRKFYAEHNLVEYSNIKLVGRDYEFFFGGYYNISVVPDLVLYDAQKKLIKLFQGETYVLPVYNELHPQ